MDGVFFPAALWLFYPFIKSRGEITRLRLTPAQLVVSTEFLFLRPSTAIPLGTIEDVALVRDGPLAGGMAVTTDDHVLMLGYQLDEESKEFLAAYIAQWVAANSKDHVPLAP